MGATQREKERSEMATLVGRRGRRKLKPSERWCGIHPRVKYCLNNFNDLGYALTSIEFFHVHFTSTVNVIRVAFGRQIFRLEVMTQSPPPSKNPNPGSGGGQKAKVRSEEESK